MKNTENEISVSLEGFLVAILSDTCVRKKGEKSNKKKKNRLLSLRSELSYRKYIKKITESLEFISSKGLSG